MKRNYPSDSQPIARQLLRCTALALPVALLVGSMAAMFLKALDAATVLRWRNGWLLYFLPLAGVGIYFLYRVWGKNAGRGNDLILEEIHLPGGGVPARMAPLVFVATIATHLFGGSAGREGTAVQIGGSIAALIARRLRLSPHDVRLLLLCGVSAGFGAVFGTPVTGAIFALEVQAIGRFRYRALLPCFVASLLADRTCAAWGVHHTAYHIAPHAFFAAGWWPAMLLLLKVLVAGAAFGLAARLFAKSVHLVQAAARRLIKPEWLIPVVGGCLIILLAAALHTTDYLGLGVMAPSPGGISIVSAFHAGGATPWSACWKLLFTAITLGCGFKGGEVTPLFFIGATLGNALAVWMGVPVDLMAGLGLIAVFAGASNTPLACILMGAELFGTDHLLSYAVACFIAYWFSGQSGIYASQRSPWRYGRKPHSA